MQRKKIFAESHFAEKKKIFALQKVILQLKYTETEGVSGMKKSFLKHKKARVRKVRFSQRIKSGLNRQILLNEKSRSARKKQ